MIKNKARKWQHISRDLAFWYDYLVRNEKDIPYEMLWKIRQEILRLGILSEYLRNEELKLYRDALGRNCRWSY